MRLFAALPLSAEATERLSRFRLRYSEPRDGLRWSESGQWHVTLQFFGEVAPEQTTYLVEALQNASLRPVELRIESFGCFANKGILLAKVVETLSLQELYEKSQRAWAPCGLAPEERLFRPHITLARTKNKAGAATLKRMTQPDLPSFGSAIRWFPQEILFLESVLRTQGAEYRVVQGIPLVHEATRQEQ